MNTNSPSHPRLQVKVEITLPPISVSRETLKWLEAQQRPGGEIVGSLLEFAAVGKLRTDSIVVAPWSRTLAELLARRLAFQPDQALFAADVFAALKQQLADRDDWPGDVLAGAAAGKLIFALTGVRKRNDLRRPGGGIGRGWGGLVLKPADAAGGAMTPHYGDSE